MINIIKTQFIFLIISSISYGQSNHKMRYEDKIRIREAINISNQFGDKIWKGINKAPFVVLLVTDSLEFLINHPYPSNDFKISEIDTILKTKIVFRPKQFSNKFLATFPAVNGVNCIVVGTPERTNKSSAEWIITLLHEHFHQYQFTQKDYYNSVEKLDLSGGDQTGMWQLSYPFPYKNHNVIRQYQRFISSLTKTLSNIDNETLKKDFRSYLKERNKFKNLLKPADYKYFSFQIWQEGIARYTEYKFLLELENYEPSKEISKLDDFVSFNKLKEKFYLTEQESLKSLKLDKDQRVCFYAIGFAEGLLLDKETPKWQEKYFEEKFFIEQYFKN